MLENPVAALLFGFVLGILMTIALSNPHIARALGKICAFVLIAAGAGLITWAIYGGATEFQSLEFGPIVFVSVAQALGWGVGCLAGGVTALVLAFVGRPPR
jgi:hypothetical protein